MIVGTTHHDLKYLGEYLLLAGYLSGCAFEEEPMKRNILLETGLKTHYRHKLLKPNQKRHRNRQKLVPWISSACWPAERRTLHIPWFILIWFWLTEKERLPWNAKNILVDWRKWNDNFVEVILFFRSVRYPMSPFTEFYSLWKKRQVRILIWK